MRWRFWRKRRKGTGIEGPRTFWLEVGARLQLDNYDEYGAMRGWIQTKAGYHIRVTRDEK